MPKFRVTFTKTTELQVEIDAAEMTEEWMAEYRRYFHDYDTLEEHAQHLGRIIAEDLTSDGDYVEGYGFIKTGVKDRLPAAYSFQAGQNPAYPRMNISVITVDEDEEVEAEEIP